GSPFEFGQGYQLANVNVHGRQILFSPAFVAFNLRLYFWEPVRWTIDSIFPAGIQMPPPPPGYFGAENPFGILTSMPFVLLAAVLPLLGRAKRGRAQMSFGYVQICLWIVFFSTASVLCTFGGACSRYQTEFLPELMLLAVLAWLALDDRLADMGLARMLVRGFCGLLLAYSVVVGRLVGASAGSPHVSLRNRDLLSLLEAGRKQEAVTGFEVHVRRYPASAASHANLGTAYFESGRLQDAVASYQRALNTDPMLVEVYNNLGVTFGQLGRVSDARRHFARALELNPDYRDAALNLARLEQKAAAALEK
ncbi:MAG: tetratricopeptide repeat protein, partial [Opitutaceae bacterium]